MNDYRITIASPPDREHLVAEVLFQNIQVAELNTETGELSIELYARPDGEPWRLDAEAFLRALAEAKSRLVGEGQ